MLKPGLESLFAEYADSHRHPTNRLTHKIAIPVIVFHVLTMLDWVARFEIPGTGLTASLGVILFLAAAVWYLSQDVKLGAIVTMASALCFPLGRMTPWPVVVALAVIGWSVQLAGHVVWEKKSPSFMKNMIQALVGPIFFIAVLTGDWPAKQAPAASRAA